MGAPAFKMKPIFDYHNIHVFSSNFALYGDLSDRVMQILSQESPAIEIYSIVLAFLDLKGVKKLNKFSIDLRKNVGQWTGLPVSIGIAPTKTLAKVANRMAKKYKKDGVFLMKEPATITRILKHVAVDELWGVGRKYSKFLSQRGFQTAYDLVNASESWIRKNMTVNGLRMIKELKGVPCLALEYETQRKKKYLHFKVIWNGRKDTSRIRRSGSFLRIHMRNEVKKRKKSYFFHISIC
jgi:DNA polymerase V